MNKFDLYFSRAMRLVAGLLGIGIAVWETLVDHGAHPWSYAAAVTFMGLPAARAAEDLIRMIASASLSKEDLQAELRAHRGLDVQAQRQRAVREQERGRGRQGEEKDREDDQQDGLESD